MNQAITERIEPLLRDMSESDLIELITHLMLYLKQTHKKKESIDLDGYLKDKVNPNFDIDEALKDIRQKWLVELKEL